MKSSNLYLICCYIFCNISCVISVSFTPQGHEVVTGSVLLPTSRRGRYLANIVRRQAIDGTQVKFNKDADRMNAESKKKVDVLSDELLPYIVGEQERRANLNRRVMTAIQSGERGVTIAEMRGRPPVAIKRGLYYRCPMNKMILEPDSSGAVMCEDSIKPTSIPYESCLMSEDAMLYVVRGKDHFFCNRHSGFQGELPHNNTVALACAPGQRTSYFDTIANCSLEKTGDVLVHYRYYPDKTYKYVSEIDPDHEICDHWNPCQIGYIFHLPNMETAIPAEDLYPPGKEGSDEETVPEGDDEEFAPELTRRYSSPLYRVPACEGCTFRGVVLKGRDGAGQSRALDPTEVRQVGGRLGIHLDKVTHQSYGQYSVLWDKGPDAIVETKLLTLLPTKLAVQPLTVTRLPGEMLSGAEVQYHCDGCLFRRMVHLDNEGQLSEVPPARVKNELNKVSKIASTQLVIDRLEPKDFGDYFMVVQNTNRVDEKIKVLEINSDDINNEIKLQAVTSKFLPHATYSLTAPYTCASCRLVRVVCAGEDCTRTMSLTPHSLSYEGSSFEDGRAGVHVGIFSVGEGREVSKRLFIVEKIKITTPIDTNISKLKKKSKTTITYACDKECTVDKLTMDSQLVSKSSYELEKGKIHLKFESVPESAVYQAKFLLGDVPITKNVLNITGAASISKSAVPATSTSRNVLLSASTIKPKYAVLHDLKSEYKFKLDKPINIMLNLKYGTADDPKTFIMKSGGETKLAIQILATRHADDSDTYQTPVRLHKEKTEASDAGEYEITVYGQEKKKFTIRVD